MTDEGVIQIAKAITSNSSLLHLDISKNYISINGLLSIIEVSNTTSLQVLNATYNNITKSDHVRLQEHVNSLHYTALTYIHTSWNDVVSNFCMKTTKFLFNKTVDNPNHASGFDFNYTEEYVQPIETVSNAQCMLKSLKKECAIQEINVSKNFIGRNFKAFKTLPIPKLDISDNQLCDDGAVTISDCLKSNDSLKELNMSMNNIHSVGGKKLTEAMKVNTSSQNLNISCNDIFNDGAGHGRLFEG